MNSFIYTCGCGDTDKFAKEAFKLLFPAEDVPHIRHGLGVIEDSDLSMVVSGLTKDNVKYAYYILQNEDGISVWDLLKGVQIL